MQLQGDTVQQLAQINGVMMTLSILVPVFCSIVCVLSGLVVRQALRAIDAQIIAHMEKANGRIEVIDRSQRSAHRKIDGHLEECNQIPKKMIVDQLARAETDLEYVKRTINWMGDGMVRMSTKLGVEIGPRPTR